MAPKNGTRRILGSKTEQLKVMLTEPEKKECAAKLARAEGDLRDHVAKMKDVASGLKARKDNLDETLRQLGQVSRDGFEYRPVPVRIEADFAEGKVYEIREDLGEVVQVRAVTPADRQSSIFEVPAADPRAPLEAEADRILANAGDEKLNDPNLKGEPSRHKKARTKTATEAGVTRT